MRRFLPLLLAPLALSCLGDDPGFSRARVVVNRADLVGGPRALGEVGDFRIENDQIRVIVQGPTHSRMLGIYGGGLIDVDLQRPRGDGEGSSQGGVGSDALGEIFPTFLLQAVEVQQVEVRNDGTDGQPAQIAARGTAGDFVELAGILNRLLLGSHTDFNDPLSNQRLEYEILYTIAPGERNVEVTLRVTNVSSDTLTFPTPEAAMLAMLAGISGDELPVPVGDVAAFSASSQAFIPGIGFDLRFGIEAAARTPRTLPALPGVPAPWIATRGDGISYGLVGAPSERNYAWLNRDQYGADGTPIDQTTVFVPFAAGGFVTVFYDVAPPELAPDESFEVVRHLVVGNGDVGSVLDEVNRLQERTVGRVGGRVIDQLTGSSALDADVLVYRRSGDTRTIFSQYDVRAGGRFGGTLEPGDYSLRVTGEGRPLSDVVDFSILADQTTALVVEAPSPARVVVRIQSPEGENLPARATLIGTYDADRVGQEPREFLYDLQVGEHPRVQDLVPDRADDASTRRYVEGQGFSRDGVVELLVRPGTYDVVSSRGPEYDTDVDTVELVPGQTVTVSHTLERVVDTTGWISADMHLHGIGSHDSAMGYDERVRSVAAEGVEWAVSSEHNFIGDYSAAIARTGLQDWLNSSIGLEVTTIESGHFNGYPLRYDVADVDHGAVEWADRPPQEIFDELRSLGSLGPERTIVQVNHARQPVLGYFSQYRRDTFTMVEQPPSAADLVLAPEGPAFLSPDGTSTFSFDFDLLEVLNGKLFRDVHHFRVPENLPPDAPTDLPETGAVVVDADGQAVFPGVVDDWYTLLNSGYRYVAVGTSDSHGPISEAGYFRTMVYVGADDPTTLEDGDFVDGLLGRRVVATNGPVVDFWVNDPADGAMGQQIGASGSTVRIGVEISAAPWIGLDQFNVVRNGQIAQVFALEPGRDYAESPFSVELELDLATDASGAPIDTWFVVEVIGRRSMFPVVRPFEVSPFQITEAVNTLTGGVSLFGPNLGSATPSENQPITAYALTNPVWVTLGPGDFRPPGPVPPLDAALPINDSGFPRGPKPPQVAGAQQGERPTASPAPPALSPWLFGRDTSRTHDLGAIMRRAALGHSH